MFMRRILLSMTAVCFVAGFIATPVASAQQSVNLWVGGFAPIGIDARHDGDVLVQDRSVFIYDFGHFTGATVGGEWVVALGDHFEAGAGLGYYQRSTTAIDCCFVDPSGFNIPATFKLRVVPFSATFRALAFGHNAPVQPYIGGGVGVYGWRYSESGDFVLASGVISRGEVNTASGSAVGPIILGGIRFPIGPTAPGFEIRWQHAHGDLPGNGTGSPFLGTVIDLGGFNYLFTFNIRF
jgi:hypothetical protein